MHIFRHSKEQIATGVALDALPLPLQPVVSANGMPVSEERSTPIEDRIVQPIAEPGFFYELCDGAVERGILSRQEHDKLYDVMVVALERDDQLAVNELSRCLVNMCATIPESDF